MDVYPGVDASLGHYGTNTPDTPDIVVEILCVHIEVFANHATCSNWQIIYHPKFSPF